MYGNSPVLISCIIRGIQLVISIFIFAFSLAINVNQHWTSSSETYIFVTTIFSIAYIVPLFFLLVVRLAKAQLIFIIEMLLTLFWFVGMIIALSNYASKTCTTRETYDTKYYYYSNNDTCYIGKAIMVLCIIQVLSFITSLSLVSIFIIHPVRQQIGFSRVFYRIKRNEFFRGGIFCHVVMVDDSYLEYTGPRRNPFFRKRDIRDLERQEMLGVERKEREMERQEILDRRERELDRQEMRTIREMRDARDIRSLRSEYY